MNKLIIGDDEFELKKVGQTMDKTDTPSLYINGDYYRGELIPKQPKRDYEILSFSCDNGILHKVSTGGFGGWDAEEKYLITSSVHKIHSVKRLSDGCVFSVGEVTNANNTIEAFKVEKDTLLVVKLRYNNSTWWVNLTSIEKNKEKPILFTTEDGVKIYDRTKRVAAIRKGYYSLLDQQSGEAIATWLNGWYTTRWLPNPKEEDTHVIRKLIREHYLIFSSIEAANEWILVNKPFLSITELGMHSKIMFGSQKAFIYYESDLIELAKSKM